MVRISIKQEEIRQLFQQFEEVACVSGDVECWIARELCELMGYKLWHGQRINSDVLGNERAAYGEQIVATGARQLWRSYFVEILPLRDELQ